MANDYRNRLTLRGERETLEKAFDSIRTKGAFNDGSDRVFDFDKVIPTPKDLEIESNSSAETVIVLLMRQSHFLFFGPYSPEVKDARERYDRWPDDLKEKSEELAKKYLMNIAKYGFPNWYSFHIGRWGTKWNAYGANERKGDSLYYETANGYPKPVVEELSKMWPDVEFELTAADEDIGSYTIKGTFKNGVFDGVEEHQTPKAYDIAFEMFPEQKEEFHQLEDGTWSCREEESDE